MRTRETTIDKRAEKLGCSFEIKYNSQSGYIVIKIHNPKDGYTDIDVFTESRERPEKIANVKLGLLTRYEVIRNIIRSNT